jgi:hypothetical protein
MKRTRIIICTALLLAISVAQIFSYSTVNAQPTHPSAENWSKYQTGIRKCMTFSGFSYFTEPPSSYNPIQPYLDFPFSKSELEIRKIKGYGIVEQQTRSVFNATKSKNAVYRLSLEKASQQKYDAALYGSQTDSSQKQSCIRTSIGLIYPPPANGLREIRLRFINNPEVAKLNNTWKKCITEKGFSSPPDVWEPRALAGAKIDVLLRKSTLADELVIARADVACVAPLLSELNRLRVEEEAR